VVSFTVPDEHDQHGRVAQANRRQPVDPGPGGQPSLRPLHLDRAQMCKYYSTLCCMLLYYITHITLNFT